MKWIEEVYALARSDTPRKAIVVIIGEFDNLFRAGEFTKADEACDSFEVERLGIGILVSLLMATFPAKDKLRRRDDLVRRLEAHIMELDPDRVESLVRRFY